MTSRRTHSLTPNLTQIDAKAKIYPARPVHRHHYSFALYSCRANMIVKLYNSRSNFSTFLLVSIQLSIYSKIEIIAQQRLVKKSRKLLEGCIQLYNLFFGAKTNICICSRAYTVQHYLDLIESTCQLAFTVSGWWRKKYEQKRTFVESECNCAKWDSFCIVSRTKRRHQYQDSRSHNLLMCEL